MIYRVVFLLKKNIHNGQTNIREPIIQDFKIFSIENFFNGSFKNVHFLTILGKIWVLK